MLTAYLRDKVIVLWLQLILCKQLSQTFMVATNTHCIFWLIGSQILYMVNSAKKKFSAYWAFMSAGSVQLCFIVLLFLSITPTEGNLVNLEQRVNWTKFLLTFMFAKLFFVTSFPVCCLFVFKDKIKISPLFLLIMWGVP